MKWAFRRTLEQIFKVSVAFSSNRSLLPETSDGSWSLNSRTPFAFVMRGEIPLKALKKKKSAKTFIYACLKITWQTFEHDLKSWTTSKLKKTEKNQFSIREYQPISRSVVWICSVKKRVPWRSNTDTGRFPRLRPIACFIPSTLWFFTVRLLKPSCSFSSGSDHLLCCWRCAASWMLIPTPTPPGSSGSGCWLCYRHPAWSRKSAEIQNEPLHGGETGSQGLWVGLSGCSQDCLRLDSQKVSRLLCNSNPTTAGHQGHTTRRFTSNMLRRERPNSTQPARSALQEFYRKDRAPPSGYTRRRSRSTSVDNKQDCKDKGINS